MAEPDDDDAVDDVADEVTCSPEVRAALRAQVNSELIREARRYARGRVDYLRQHGHRVDQFYHHDLVQEVLANLWQGTLRWDPQQQPLIARVISLVRQRTANEVRHARRFPHQSLHAGVGDERADIDADAGGPHASRGDLSPILIAAVADEVVTELRRLAARDLDACAILGCWERGITERVEVLARTALTPAAYHNARRRILYLADNLPPQLRQAAREILRSAS